MDQKPPTEQHETTEESILKKAASNAVKGWVEWAEKRILVCLSIYLLWLNYQKDEQHRDDIKVIFNYLLTETHEKERSIDTKQEILKQLSDEK